MQQGLFYLLTFFACFIFSSCSSQVRLAEENSSPSGNRLAFMDEITLDNSVNTKRGHLLSKDNKRHQKAIKEEPQPDFPSLLKIANTKAFTTDSSLASFIEDWLGVRYRLGGTTRSGIDCSAFSQRLFASVYDLHITRTARSQFSQSLPIYNYTDLKEGDLVFFKIKSSSISHVGVYLSDGYFVQASNHGVMISNLNEAYWNRYFFAGGRIKG